MITKKKASKTSPAKQFERATLPHQILSVALRHLRLCEANAKKYTINMNTWVERYGRKCSVCLAGAVMMQAYPKQCQSQGLTVPSCLNFSPEIDDKLMALDHLRVGHIDLAASSLHIEGDYSHLDRKNVRYEDDRQVWWKQMRQLVKDLKGAGL